MIEPPEEKLTDAVVDEVLGDLLRTHSHIDELCPGSPGCLGQRAASVIHDLLRGLEEAKKVAWDEGFQEGYDEGVCDHE